MSHSTSFDDVLDAVEQLSTDEQQTLLEVVQRRIAERRRKALAAEIADANQEFTNGGSRPATADELLNEIAS